MILPILCISQIVGGHAMDDYAEYFIDDVIPNYGRVLLASLDVISVAVCLYAIEKVGRRPLLIISTSVSALCCLILAIYRVTLAMQNTKEKMVVPTTIVVIYYSVYSLGLTPVLPVLTGEIFPSRMKTVAVGLTMMLVYLVAATMQMIYMYLNETAGGCWGFVIFALVGSIGLPLAASSLPETRGKSLSQIQADMENVPVVIS